MCCLLCVEVQKGKLTSLEIARNYYEMKLDEDPEHWADLVAEIAKIGKLDEVSKALSDLNKGEVR